MGTGVRDRFEFLSQLHSLTGRRYVAAALVLTRPRWGLGAFTPIALGAEALFPWFSGLDRLGAHMLCLNDAGMVEDWVVISSPGHGRTPSSPEHFLGEVPADSLALSGFGIVSVRATWGVTRGRVPRRLVGDFVHLAGSGLTTRR